MRPWEAVTILQNTNSYLHKLHLTAGTSSEDFAIEQARAIVRAAIALVKAQETMDEALSMRRM